MDPSSIAATVRDLSTFLAPVGGLALVVAVLSVIYRTGSGHILRRRIWRLIHGKDEVSDPHVKAFVDEQTSLMAFRFESNLRVRTIERARNLAIWLKANDEDVSTVRRSGTYFDIEECRLKDRLPSKKLLAPLVLATGMLAILTLFPLRGAVDHRVLLQVTKSGTWFLVSPKVDQSLRWKPWSAGEAPAPLRREACSGDLSAVLQPTQFAAEDAKVICGLFQDANAPDYLTDSLWKQRISLAFVVFVLVVIASGPLRWLMAIDAAHGMSERIKKRDAQAELDFGGHVGSQRP